MTGKLSPTAQQQLATLQSFTQLIGRINSLVEQYATARTGQEQIKASLKRAATQGKVKLLTAGLDQLAQTCGSIELASARPGPPAQQARTLRELVGSLRFQMDSAMRTIVREDQEVQARKQQEKTTEARETDA